MSELENEVSELLKKRTELSLQISDFYSEAKKRELSSIENAVLNEMVREYQKLSDEIEELDPTPKRLTTSELMDEVKRTGKTPLEILEEYKRKTS